MLTGLKIMDVSLITSYMGYEPPAKAPMGCWDPVSKAVFRSGPCLPGRPHRWCRMSCNYDEMSSLEAY